MAAALTCPIPSYLLYTPDETIEGYSSGNEFKYSCDARGGNCTVPLEYYVGVVFGMVVLFVIIMVALCVESCGATWAQQLRCRCLPDPQRRQNSEFKWPSRGACCCGCCTPTCRKPGTSPGPSRPFLGCLLGIAMMAIYITIILVQYEESLLVQSVNDFIKPNLLDFNLDFVDRVRTSAADVQGNATASSAALATAFTTISTPQQEALLVRTALEQTITMVMNVTAQISDETNNLSYQLGNATDELESLVTRYDGIRHTSIIGLLTVVGVLVAVNAIVLTAHCMTKTKHYEAYHRWRFCYAPTVLVVMFVLWIVTIMYFALALVMSTLCVDPTGVLLGVLNNTFPSNSLSSYGDQRVSVKFGFSLPNGVSVDVDAYLATPGVQANEITLYNDTLAQELCNLPNNNFDTRCLYVNVSRTAYELMEYYFDCGKTASSADCLIHPLFAVELVLANISQITPQILGLSAQIIQTNSAWTNFSTNFYQTFKTLSGGPITPTGTQPFGLCGSISCSSLNQPISSIFRLLCTDIFTNIGMTEYYLFAMVLSLVIVEITTRGIYWRGKGYQEVFVTDDDYPDHINSAEQPIMLWNIGDDTTINSDIVIDEAYRPKEYNMESYENSDFFT
eukprot:m.129548 g.129548  ORF g.129548 m.129548 type:complete len:621 (-) comp29407_c0_seq1:263-2125(-)